MKFAPQFKQLKTFDFNDTVKPNVRFKMDKEFMFSGKDGIVIPRFKIEYYNDEDDTLSKFIDFELKIVSEKLDEVAKDENVESGVEDSEPEEK